MGKAKVIIPALLTMLSVTEGCRAENYDIPVDTEGMKDVQAKLRKMRSNQKLSKRNLKKRQLEGKL